MTDDRDHLRCACCRARLGDWLDRHGQRILRLDVGRIRAAEYHHTGLMVRCKGCGAGTIVPRERRAA